MKAIVCEKYGSPDVLKLKEVDKPSPGKKEILVKLNATTVTSRDIRIRSFHFPPSAWLFVGLVFGFRKPKNPILGSDLAGVVEAVGEGVKIFKPGDKIFGTTSGMKLGAWAEYICLPEEGVIGLKPDNVSDTEAGAIAFGGLTALHYLRKGNIQPGQKVLVYGASGSLGTFGVQLAKHFGAEVTGVCSTAKTDFVESIGADEVIDYQKEDFTKSKKSYDIIFDTIGKTSFLPTLKALTKNGMYLQAVGSLAKSLPAIFLQKGGKKIIGGIADFRREDLMFLMELVQTGKIKSIVDKVYPLEMMDEAHKYIDAGYKKGNVAITI